MLARAGRADRDSGQADAVIRARPRRHGATSLVVWHSLPPFVRSALRPYVPRVVTCHGSSLASGVVLSPVALSAAVALSGCQPFSGKRRIRVRREEVRVGRRARDANARFVEARCRYRFASFSRAHDRLRKALAGDIALLNSLELAGVIRRFALTVDLGWKLLNDCLVYHGISIPIATPRAVVRAAYRARLIKDGDTWMDMLGDRSRTVHMYDAHLALDVVTDVQSRYLPTFARLQAKTREQMPT